MARTILVFLSAARIRDESRRPAKVIRAIPMHGYDSEVLSNDTCFPSFSYLFPCFGLILYKSVWKFPQTSSFNRKFHFISSYLLCLRNYLICLFDLGGPVFGVCCECQNWFNWNALLSSYPAIDVKGTVIPVKTCKQWNFLQWKMAPIHFRLLVQL